MVLAGIKVDPVIYTAKATQPRAEDCRALFVAGNLLLLADKPAEARGGGAVGRRDEGGRRGIGCTARLSGAGA